MNVPPATIGPPVVPPVAGAIGGIGFPPNIVPPFSMPPPGFGAPPSGELGASFANAPPSSEWTEHKAPDGRAYFYNAVTKQSSWDKPESLMTPTERLQHLCPWKEYCSDAGKVYYHNINTKESRWEAPPEFREMKVKLQAEEYDYLRT